MWNRLLVFSFLLLFVSLACAADEPPADVRAVLAARCVDCHNESVSEGNIRLDQFAALGLDERLELLNAAQEQLFFRRMPPSDADQPTGDERERLARWFAAELKQHGASKLEDKLRRPEYGNAVRHDDLFSGKYAHLPSSTPDRRWLISEYIFDAKFNRILKHTPFQTIDGKREFVGGSNNRRVNLTNPFLLPTNSGVRYYANETLSGGHLLTMLTNAKEASRAMIELTRRDARYLPAASQIMDLAWTQEKTLASREAFLAKFIEYELQEVFGDEHASLLPKFVRVEIGTSTANDGETKKAPYHAANPGNAEVELIFRTMRRQKSPGINDDDLIAKCEREWFNRGHNPRKIASRLTFLANYWEEFHQQAEQHKFDQRYRAHEYRPLPEQELLAVRDSLRTHRAPGDRFDDLIAKCVDQWSAEFEQARIEAGPPNREKIDALVSQLFVLILEREPAADEVSGYASLADSYFESLGNLPAIEKLMQTLLLNSEFVYRMEFGTGTPDKHGRRMMSPRDASYALAYALTDSSPDEELRQAAEEGRLHTRADYRREVLRMLARRDRFTVVDEAVERLQLTASFTNMPVREHRFFREFFGYPQMLPIFKDNKRFGGNYDNSKGRLVGEADRLVEHILERDRNVIEELLTTEKFYVYHSGDNEAMTASSERIRTIYEYFKKYDWENFEQEDLLAHKEFLEQVQMRGVDVKNLASKGRRNSLREFKTALASFTLRFDDGETAAAPYVSFPAHGKYNASTRAGLQLRAPEVAKFYNIRLDKWDYPAVQPAKVAHRKGMLTHPAWLIAHAQNTETDPVKRGRWIREKLLAGLVPDVPITVDAVIPEDPHRTLRQRLDAKTGDAYCWKCHQQMNPLGLPFEVFDDFGRYRTAESLEYPENLLEKGPDKAAVHVDLRDTYKTLPVDSRGHLRGSGDADLDGDVTDALDLIDRLAQSDRVRQSVIRHAFRYFLGRNETLPDSKTLMDADRAYLDSGGSFDAVIVSLLTSDSFIYRTANSDAAPNQTVQKAPR